MAGTPARRMAREGVAPRRGTARIVRGPAPGMVIMAIPEPTRGGAGTDELVTPCIVMVKPVRVRRAARAGVKTPTVGVATTRCASPGLPVAGSRGAGRTVPVPPPRRQRLPKRGGRPGRVGLMAMAMASVRRAVGPRLGVRSGHVAPVPGARASRAVSASRVPSPPAAESGHGAQASAAVLARAACDEGGQEDASVSGALPVGRMPMAG